MHIVNGIAYASVKRNEPFIQAVKQAAKLPDDMMMITFPLVKSACKFTCTMDS